MAIICIGTVLGALSGMLIAIGAGIADAIGRRRFYDEIGIR